MAKEFDLRPQNQKALASDLIDGTGIVENAVTDSNRIMPSLDDLID